MSRGLGRLQRKALLALWRADGHRVPLGDLKRAMGGDRGNSRRAIRVLLDRGMVEEAGEGNLKLTAPAMYALVIAEHFGDLSEEKVPSSLLDLDSILAEEEPAWGPHANAVTPCKRRLFPETRVSDNAGQPHGSWEPPWIRELSFDPPVRDNGPGAPSLTRIIADALEGHQDETKGERK